MSMPTRPSPNLKQPKNKQKGRTTVRPFLCLRKSIHNKKIRRIHRLVIAGDGEMDMGPDGGFQ